MAISRRTLPSGMVSWRVKLFWEQRVMAQKSFDRLADAKRWEADQAAKLRAGEWIDPARSRMSFARLAEEWQSSRDHLATRSQETTRYLLDRDILPVLGRVPLAAITATDIERVLTAMTARGLATSTRRRALSVMRLVLDRALQDRRLSTNVAQVVPLPRGNTRREPYWLSAQELGRLADAVPVQCRPVVLFLGLSGCRFSEMAALSVSDERRRSVHTVRAAAAAPGAYLFPTRSGLIWTNTNFRLRSKHEVSGPRGNDHPRPPPHRGLTPHRGRCRRQGGPDHPWPRFGDDDHGPVRAPVLRRPLARDGALAELH